MYYLPGDGDTTDESAGELHIPKITINYYQNKSDVIIITTIPPGVGSC